MQTRDYLAVVARDTPLQPLLDKAFPDRLIPVVSPLPIAQSTAEDIGFPVSPLQLTPQQLHCCAQYFSQQHPGTPVAQIEAHISKVGFVVKAKWVDDIQGPKVEHYDRQTRDILWAATPAMFKLDQQPPIEIELCVADALLTVYSVNMAVLHEKRLSVDNHTTQAAIQGAALIEPQLVIATASQLECVEVEIPAQQVFAIASQLQLAHRLHQNPAVRDKCKQLGYQWIKIVAAPHTPLWNLYETAWSPEYDKEARDAA